MNANDLVPKGGTSLFDALMMSCDYFKQESGGRRRVILMLTDGEDNVSNASLQQATTALAECGAQVYGFNTNPENSTRKQREVMDAIAEVSGGRWFQRDTFNGYRTKFGLVAQELERQYLISYEKPPVINKEVEVALASSPKTKLRVGQPHLVSSLK